jgi:Phytanoyl-CoA dioxygenase (PhyH)
MSVEATGAGLCPRQFAADGVMLARGLVDGPLLRRINDLLRTRAALVMAALGSRPIGIGSRDGYHELVQRSPGRFDVPLTERDLAPLWGTQGSTAAEVPWIELVRAALGMDAAPSFCGVVFSRPGSPAQQWHIDSPHEAPEHLPAHAVNVLVALADIPLAAGPTEVAPGTHCMTNHLQRPWLDRDDLLYQTQTEITPAMLRGTGDHAHAPAQDSFARPMAAGDCLIFDDRILHRGLANASGQERWVAYFSYLRPRPGLQHVADTHFEASRSLF